MRFERERDIPQLRAGTRKERDALRQWARVQDPCLRKLEFLRIVLAGFLILLADWVGTRIGSGSLFVWFAAFALFAVPFLIGFRGFFIIPRIRRALMDDKGRTMQPAASGKGPPPVGQQG